MLRPHAVRAARGALIRQALPHFAVCRRGVAVSAQGRHRTPCGAVGAVHNEGDVVTVYGWVEVRTAVHVLPIALSGWPLTSSLTQRTRNFGGLLFVTLRDSSGAVQLVLPDEASEGTINLPQRRASTSIPRCADARRRPSVLTRLRAALAHRAAHLRSESVVEVRGVLRRRPEDMVNPRMRTGAVELVLEEVAEMNPCDGAVPIPVCARCPPLAARRASPRVTASSGAGGGPRVGGAPAAAPAHRPAPARHAAQPVRARQGGSGAAARAGGGAPLPRRGDAGAVQEHAGGRARVCGGHAAGRALLRAAAVAAAVQTGGAGRTGRPR